LLAAVGSGAAFAAWLYGRLSFDNSRRTVDLLAWPENAGRTVFGIALAVLLWTFARRLRAEAAAARTVPGPVDSGLCK
jgi:hypothetical protein